MITQDFVGVFMVVCECLGLDVENDQEESSEEQQIPPFMAEQLADCLEEGHGGSWGWGLDAESFCELPEGRELL